MPFQDLPHRREDSAPVLDLSDPCEILRYFDDIEFLFLKHRVSDDQEKKRAAVRYPSVAVEQLWKTARAFSDTARSYEDFKVEVIALYPEAIAAQEHTLADLDELVAHRARTPIRSEIELGAYYREFLLVSRFLVAKDRISVQTQAHHLLASFEPRLATAVRARLVRTFPDHLPDDPYETDAVCDAALFALAWQRAAPLIEPPRDVSTPFTSSLASPALFTFPPLTVQAFPLATEPRSPAPSDPRTVTHALKQECAASLVPAPRDAAPLFTTSPATPLPIQIPPQPAQVFPPALQFVQADAPATVPTFAPKCAAPLISAARNVLPPSASTLAPRAPVLSTPTPVNAFLTAPEPAQPVQPDTTAATLDALAEAIASLKSGLEAILDTQKSAESRAPDPEAAQSRSEQCKFCGSSTHLEEECEEADEYILAGMCKRNVFGRLTLPSGAEVSRRIKGKFLRERFEEYHRQYPGQRAAPAYLEDLARPGQLALQEVTPVTPSVMGATSPGAEAMHPATFEVLRQPHRPERTLCDPRAASDQARAPDASGNLRKHTSEHQRTSAVTSSAQSQTCESNFAATAASDCGEAPLMVSQRGLFACVPGVRSETVHAAASTPAPPRECAVYLVQRAAPQHARDRVPGSAKPSKIAQRTHSIAQRAHSIAQRAHSIAQRAHSIAQRAHSIAQRAHSIAQRAHSIAQRAHSIAQRARSIAQHAHSIAQRARYQPSPLQHLQASMRHAKWQHPVQPSRSLAQPSTANPPNPSRNPKSAAMATKLSLPPRVSPQAPSPIHCASLTLSDTLDSDATGAQTPAMHADSRSDVSGQRKRLQPTQRRARVPQCNCDDRAICSGSPSHVAMTASEPHSRRFPRRAPAAPCVAAAAQEQRKRSRSGVPQAASSTDTTVSAPQSRGSSYVTHGRQMTARIDSSTFRFRGSRGPAAAPYARGRARRVRQSAIIASTRNSIYDTRGNVREQQRQRHLRADVRGALTTRRQYKTLAVTFTTHAAIGSPYACRDISNRATFAQAPAPLPRRHARQQRRENNQEQPHQVASSADATASAPQLRGGSHVAIEFQRTLCIDRSVYRSRSSVRDRTRSGSSKTDSQRSKERKRKTAAATTVALRTRRRARCVRRSAIIVSTRDSIYDTRGDQRSQVPQTRARQEQLALGEEHPLATYLKRKRTSNSTAIVHPLATCLDDKDDTAYHLTHFRLLRLRAPRPSAPRSPALSCAQLRSPALSCARPRSAALARAQLRSPALSCARPRSAALARAQLRSAALAHTLSHARLHLLVLSRALAHFAAFLRTCVLCRALARFAALSKRSRAALARGLSNSSATRSRLQRPPIPSFAPRRSVRDRFRPPATRQLHFPFPTSPHLRAALFLRQRRVRDRRKHIYDTARPAETCATACNASHPQNPACIIDRFPAIRDGLVY
ncbi:hypothetical protein EDB85DRAFT_2153994 [Lactarius pseudohatsudake]|nr:hypothetical protein EDB85DRAFT_2153994 [Lactarius pseudohatsudake]